MAILNAAPILLNRRHFFMHEPEIASSDGCCRVEANGDLSANFAMVWTGSRREWTCMACHRTVRASGSRIKSAMGSCSRIEDILCVDYGFHGVYWSCCRSIGDEIFFHGCEPTWTAEYWLLQHHLRPRNGAVAGLVDLTNDVEDAQAVATGTAVQQVVAIGSAVQQVVATGTAVQEAVATGIAVS